ncbi:MAG: hypothetical protein LBI19_09355 [Oscillospiraceae bacterium]|nr:hypothetical protein [Oscillospiraceae bacterium]
MDKQSKMTIDECCDNYLLDPVLKQGMLNLFVFFKKLKMKPIWYHKTSYKYNYKSKCVVYINFGKTDWLRIRVCTVGNMHGIGDMDLYMQMLDDEAKNEYMNYLDNFTPCNICKECKGVCERKRSYYITNPTHEQFMFIEKFILERRKYIDFTT